tara:strand:- start:30943 stop:31230 length:288 start_codon:yes stop_codon:yes gene_type:complete
MTQEATEIIDDCVVAGIPKELLSKEAVVIRGFDEAVVGYTDPGILVYSYNKIVDIVASQWTDDMSRDDAYEYVAINITGLQENGAGFVMLYGPRC